MIMAIGILVLAAGAAAQSAHWVPLNSNQAKQAQGQVAPKAAPAPVAPAPAPPPPTVVVAPGSSVTPLGVVSEPITAQVAPINVPVMVAPAGAQAPLALTCTGGGVADKQRGSFLAGRWGWASMVSHHDREFADQIDIRLFSGDDRIRIPRTMLPGFHGGHDGWFKLKDVVADARAIHAHAAVAAFHNPQVYIDRVTGTISISGKSGDYSGQCQVIDANAPAKF
jgi:hypothetical protein